MKIKELLNKLQNKKYKCVVRFFVVILFLYLLLIIFVKTIQTIATFPAIFVNVQDAV
jgi:hypothetical protein